MTKSSSLKGHITATHLALCAGQKVANYVSGCALEWTQAMQYLSMWSLKQHLFHCFSWGSYSFAPLRMFTSIKATSLIEAVPAVEACFLSCKFHMVYVYDWVLLALLSNSWFTVECTSCAGNLDITILVKTVYSWTYIVAKAVQLAICFVISKFCYI